MDNKAIITPRTLIISTQRSGTHLLVSLIGHHPEVKAYGEIYLKFRRSGRFPKVEENCASIGILMYSQLATFYKLGGNLGNHKIIHLLRQPHDVAMSRLQMAADKKSLGPQYKAHYRSNSALHKEIFDDNLRESPDLSKLKVITARIAKQQKLFKIKLQNIPHFEINFEDICPRNQQITTLNGNLSNSLLNFLGLPNWELSTKYLKTGIKPAYEVAGEKG